MKIKFFYFEKDEMSLLCDKEVSMCKGLAKIEKFNIESSEGIVEANFYGIRETPAVLLFADNDAELVRWERKFVSYREIIDEIEDCK